MSEFTSLTFHPKRILVPVDFSPSSISATEVAADMARNFHAELCLLHVIPMLPIVAESGSALFYPDREFLTDAQQDSTAKMTETVTRLSLTGVKAYLKLEIGNDVVGNVLMVLEREHADMLVISTHGLSGWRPAVFGTIAEGVIKQAKCPLLLLRSAKP